MIQLLTDEIKSVSHGETLLTTGVGSCIALCIWDPFSKIGGMAHISQPDSRTPFGDGIMPKGALLILLEQVQRLGAKRGGLVSWMAGGGNMFPSTENTAVGDIGGRIARDVVDALKEQSLFLRGRDIGGPLGRSVRLFTAEGSVEVTNTRGETIRL